MDFGFEDREEAASAEFGAVFGSDYYCPRGLAVEAEGRRHFGGWVVLEEGVETTLSFF